MLAKYNFLFLVIALILGSCFTKQTRLILFNIKSLLAGGIVVLFTSPYYLWLLERVSEAQAYLSSRGDLVNGDFNYFLSVFKLSISAISPILIYLLFFTVLSFYLLKRDSLKIQDLYFSLDKKLLAISLASYIVPVIIFTFNKANKLAGGWLAVSHFITIMLLFSILVKLLKPFEKKLLQYIFLGLNIVFFLIKLSWIYIPDLHPKIHRLNIPYHYFYTEIKDKVDLSYFKNRIVDDQIIAANFNAIDSDLDFQTLSLRKEIFNRIENDNGSLLILFNRFNQKEKFIAIFENFLNEKARRFRYFDLTANYLHSDKKKHEIRLYLLDSST